MPIDFFDTLRSTRADGKLLSVDAISGSIVKSISISGETLELTVQKADGTEETKQFVGPKQPGKFLRRVATQASVNFNVASFLGLTGQETRTNSFVLPIFTTPWHRAFWQEATGLEMTGLVSGRDLWSSYTGPTALEIDSVPGYFWRTKFSGSNRTESTWEMLFDSDLPVFKRFATFRTETQGTTFAAADFAVAGRFTTSLTSSLPFSTVDTSITESVYWAVAVPDAQPDIIDIGTVGSFGGSSFAQWERQPGTIQLDGAAHKIWRYTLLNFPARFVITRRIAQQESERF